MIDLLNLIKKYFSVIVAAIMIVFIVLMMIASTIVPSRAELDRARYNQGYRDARQNQNFDLGGNKDTVYVYHDGAKFSVFIKNDTMRVDISLDHKGE